jgi:hypothetical protein
VANARRPSHQSSSWSWFVLDSQRNHAENTSFNMNQRCARSKIIIANVKYNVLCTHTTVYRSITASVAQSTTLSVAHRVLYGAFIFSVRFLTTLPFSSRLAKPPTSRAPEPPHLVPPGVLRQASMLSVRCSGRNFVSCCWIHTRVGCLASSFHGLRSRACDITFGHDVLPDASH